jgi:hypothetical protein
MNTLPSTHERARLRRALVQLASLLVLTLLICGLVSLFSLWSMERLHERSQAQQAELLHAVNSARSAQVWFKIQVQGWKNILLRGGNAVDFETSRHELESAEGAADQSLTAVADWSVRVGDMELTGRINQLKTIHSQIGVAYRAAMPAPSAATAEREHADAKVRGIDRPFNVGLGELVNNMLDKDVKSREASRLEEHRRFATLSQAIWVSLGFSLLLVTVLLWRTLRDPALRA